MSMAEKILYEDEQGCTGRPELENHRRSGVDNLQALALLFLFIISSCAYNIFGDKTASIKAPPQDQTINEAAPSVGTTTWHKCGSQSTPGVECGSIAVPLDYFNDSQGISTIALGRYKATKFPKKGTVFLNPGGPGGSGTGMATETGALFAEIIGPFYDLVGFDPRGIGQTTPRVQCFLNPLDRQIFMSNTVMEQGFTVSSNLSERNTREHLVEQQREFLAMKKAQAELCAVNMGETLRYMGTATVVRDIEYMTRMMEGEDALINFWGGSYGTIIGSYLVNMFPERVGKIAIDGVADPVLWASKPSQFWHREWISSLEDTYQIFLETCSEAGPEICPLSRYANEDPMKIEHRIDAFLDRLYSAPLSVPYARRPGYLTAGGVRSLLHIFMEYPSRWPVIAVSLAEAMSGNGTSMLNTLLPIYGSSDPDLSFSSDVSRLAVTCLDSPPPADRSEFPTPEDLAEIGLGTLRDVSRHFGVSQTVSEPDGGCQYWPVTGPERFTGPWNHTLRNPILIVSNTADPITPIASGRLVNSLLYNSSRLLIQKSPGHGSMALPSLCTIKAYRAYYINGTLPPNELVCDVDEHPFPREDSVRHMSAEDARLLQAARKLGDMMMRLKMKRTFGI